MPRTQRNPDSRQRARALARVALRERQTRDIFEVVMHNEDAWAALVSAVRDEEGYQSAMTAADLLEVERRAFAAVSAQDVARYFDDRDEHATVSQEAAFRLGRAIGAAWSKQSAEKKR